MSGSPVAHETSASPYWIELAVAAPAEAEETVAAALAACGTLGAWTVPGLVRAYFPDTADALLPAFDAAWREMAGESCPYPLTTRRLAPVDWLAGWRESVRPIRVTARLWVAPPGAPPGREAMTPGAAVVWIEPGQGFGTGSHPTTQALLRWLDREPGFDRVLDVGTGSGVLSLTAIARGAGKAIGIDIDQWAVMNAARNRTLNDGGLRLALVQGPLDAVAPGARFDCVVANLDGDSLGCLLPDLAARCADGGRVGVAGALAGDRERLLGTAARSGLALLDESADRDLHGPPDEPDNPDGPDNADGPDNIAEWWSAWLTPDR